MSRQACMANLVALTCGGSSCRRQPPCRPRTAARSRRPANMVSGAIFAHRPGRHATQRGEECAPLRAPPVPYIRSARKPLPNARVAPWPVVAAPRHCAARGRWHTGRRRDPAALAAPPRAGGGRETETGPRPSCGTQLGMTTSTPRPHPTDPHFSASRSAATSTANASSTCWSTLVGRGVLRTPSKQQAPEARCWWPGMTSGLKGGRPLLGLKLKQDRGAHWPATPTVGRLAAASGPR